MFRLKRRLSQPVRWILVVAAIGVGSFAYTILWQAATSGESVVVPELVAMPPDTSPRPAASDGTDELGVQELTIVTWNINYANRDLAEVSRLLQESNADIVCLQETTEYSEAWLQYEFAEPYPHYFIAGHTGKFLAEGYMVLSRLPILEPRFVPPACTFFGHIVFQTDHCGTRSTILSVHMTPFTARESRTIVDLLSAVNQTEIDHQHEVQAILKDIPRDAPTLIVGDFNSPSHGIAPTILKGHGLKDLFAELYPDADQTHKSWDFRFRNGLRATWRIDYIFYSHHYQARCGSLLECRGSDHHLLVATFDCDGTSAPLPFHIPQKMQH